MKHHILPILLIVAVSISLYANTLKNGFVYDDEFTIVDNTLIKDLGNLPVLFDKKEYFSHSGEASYRPAVTFTYFIDYTLYGMKLWGYHLTNILLHAANGSLLYVFLTLLMLESDISGRIGITPPLQSKGFGIADTLSNPPLLITLLFVTHPILTEAVNAVSFREDLLFYFFYMVTLSVYLLTTRCSVNLRPLPLTISYITYFIALLSKEMAATLPLIIYCYEWIYVGRRWSVLLNRYNIGYITLTCVYAYLRFYSFYDPIENSIHSWTVAERLLSLPWLLSNYLKLMIFPCSLSADYVLSPVKPFSLSFILSCTLLILLFVITIRIKMKRDAVFGILFFLITLLPVSNLIPIANPLAERYLYLPATGFAIACVSAIYTARIRKSYILIYLVILSINSFTVLQRNKVWENDYSLWNDTIKKMPNSSRAHHNLGIAYYDQEWFDAAVWEYSLAINLKPNNPNAHNSLGIIYSIQGKASLAIEEYQVAIKLKPSYAEAHNNLGSTYYLLGWLDEAMQEFQTAIRLKPGYAKAYYNIGKIYSKKGLKDEARMAVERALKLNPDLLSRKEKNRPIVSVN